jgi:hypothetical protein
MKRPLVLLACCVPICGCAASSTTPRVVETAGPKEQAALIERVKGLQGDWEMVDEAGKRHPGAAFKVTSAGSAVREVLFPGQDHEMVDMYHMDGPTLVMTHYCAQGNQPRMRAKAGAPGVIALEYDSVTNLREPEEMYMGAMTLTIKDKDTIREDWTMYKQGKAVNTESFEMKRKK